MVKKKKTTDDFRNITQITLGSGLALNALPLMSNPSAANLSKATTGTVNIAVFSPFASAGYDAIDNITKAGKKKSKKK